MNIFNENQTIGLALIGSLAIHGLVFAFSQTTFLPQHAHYSVQPSDQMVEISVQDIKESSPVTPMTAPSIKKAVEINSAKTLKAPIPSKRESVIGGKISKSRSVSKQAADPISSVIVKLNPDYIQNPPPEYPEMARQMRQEGLVLLTVDVNTAGDPIKVDIKRSSGFHLLDQAAYKAVWHWKFQPGSIGNIHLESTVTVPIRFRLE